MKTPQRFPYHLDPHCWLFHSAGDYTGIADHRGLLQIRHPWIKSHEGHFGEWHTQVPIPRDQQNHGRVFLSFYQSDNYSVDENDAEGWGGIQAFVGHRFKQLLIDGVVVWEEDVAVQEMTEPSVTTDDDGQQKSTPLGYHDPYRVVDITPYAREEMMVAFRVVDKVASTTVLPGDRYWRFIWGESDPEKSRYYFHTEAFFGDVAITTSSEPVRPERSHKVAQSLCSIPRQNGKRTDGIALKLQSTGALPSEGYPVRCGVPLPRGMVRRASPFALIDPRGESIPANVTATSHWPDGSVRWILCEFVAKRKGTWRLLPGGKPSKPEQRVLVQHRTGGIVVSNGRLTLKVGHASGEGLFDEIALDGNTHLNHATLSIKLNRVGWLEPFKAIRQKVLVEKSNEVCAVMRIDGEFRSELGTHFGPWSARLHFWAGLPCVLVDWRLVNESDQAMAMLLDWSARFVLPNKVGALADFGAFQPVEPRDLEHDVTHRAGFLTSQQVDNLRGVPVLENSFITCRQEKADLARLYCVRSLVGKVEPSSVRMEQAPGFLRLRHRGQTLVAAMRWFVEEFPKGIVLHPEELRLATAPQPEDTFNWQHDAPRLLIGRGEAKRQTFALWLHDGELSAREAGRFNACVQDPPRLYDRKWFLDSGALDTGPSTQRASLRTWEQTVGPRLAWSAIDVPRLGHREYWDTAWMNDYRSRAHIGLLRYMETGEARWFRYFEAACRHTCDVDVIHFCPEHPEWVGSCHEYSADHTSGHPMSNIGLNSDDLLEHYLMTGDRDSLEAAEGLAEHILQCSAWSRSARAVGWPLAQVARWYDQTHDGRFRVKAQELMRAASVFTEPRRGIFDEIHGNMNYHGSVPFMTAYLAYGLIRCHQATGDPAAGELLCNLADGLIAECQPEPGFFRYSPFPENNLYRWGSGTVACTCGWSVNIGGLLGYLYLCTGHAVYGKAARDCFDAVLKHPDQVSMDMTQLGGWLLRAVAGEPPTVANKG